MVSGSGLWFEPYAYQADAEYMGPYVYKDGDTPILTYDRSQSSYDYVSRDFYKIVSNGETEPKFTKAYHDEVLDCDMVNCSAPMYNADGTYMGCVTVDITLDDSESGQPDVSRKNRKSISDFVGWNLSLYTGFR